MDYKNSRREIIKTLSESWLQGQTLRKVTLSLVSEIKDDIAKILKIMDMYGSDVIHQSYIDQNVDIAISLIQDQVRCFCVGHIQEDQLIQQITWQAKLLKNAIEWNINSFIDPLTWLYNRAFLEKIAATWKYYSVIVVDLDTLNLINNTFWHKIWDLYIKVFADMLRTSVRVKQSNTEEWIRETSSRLDFPIRMWGDEFVLLVDTDSNQVIEDKIIPRIQSKEFVELFKQELEEVLLDQRSFWLTPQEAHILDTHAGCSVWTALSNGVSTIKELIDIADEDMYNNKTSNEWAIQRLVDQFENLPLLSKSKFLKALQSQMSHVK